MIDKVKLEKEKILLKNRKEVDINKDGSRIYTIKEGPNKGKTFSTYSEFQARGM
jgi:hypothetical protein